MWWLTILVLILGLLYLHSFNYQRSPAYFRQGVREKLDLLNLAIGQVRKIAESCSEECEAVSGDAGELLDRAGAISTRVESFSLDEIEDTHKLRQLDEELLDALLLVNRARRGYQCCVEHENEDY